MANIYVRSTDGLDTDTGATWALAKATLTGAAAIDAAGDNIYLSQSHAESTAAAVTFNFAGTSANPVKVVCVNDAAEPPTAVASTATVTTTGNSAITINGSCYVEGIKFVCSSGATGNVNINLSPVAGVQYYKNVTFEFGTTGGNSDLVTAPNNVKGHTIFENVGVVFIQALQSLIVRQSFEWHGGSVTATSVNLTRVIDATDGGKGSRCLISGVDFSGIGAGSNLAQAESAGSHVVFRNCKLPASWTGSLTSATPSEGNVVEMHNCDSADTNYRLWVESYYGSIKSETTIVRTSGASDGTTAYSWRVASNANANYPLGSLDTIELPARWNSTVAAAVTVTVEILHDSLTNLTDADVWLEVQYLGTAGFPRSLYVSDAKANILAAAADQTASAAAWTTTGLTNPNKHKLAVTFTPQEVGFIQAKVHLAKPSYTVFVDPKMTVS